MTESSTKYCDGVFENGHILTFSDGRVAVKVDKVPPGESRGVLISSGTTSAGIGVISSLSPNEDTSVVPPGSRVSFSGGSDEKPPSFSALLG